MQLNIKPNIRAFCNSCNDFEIFEFKGYPIWILVFVFGDWYGVDNSLAQSLYKEIMGSFGLVNHTETNCSVYLTFS